MNDLFPPEFLAAIERLSIDARPAPASDRAGAHLSRTAGASLDFRDYRPYTPGDDLRRVDWNVYRRSGHLFLRRFQHPAATPVHVVVDNSASMFVETPSRYAAAARVAAAVCAAALRNHDPLSVHSAASGPSITNATGHRRLPEVLSYLTDLRANSAVNPAERLRAVRPGIAIVISDFFHEPGIDALAAQLDPLPHRLVLLQVTQPCDADPSLDDDAELVDCETGRAVDVGPSSAALASYRSAYTAYQASLRAFAARRASVFAQVDASAPLLPQLATLFPGGVLRVKGWSAQ